MHQRSQQLLTAAQAQARDVKSAPQTKVAPRSTGRLISPDCNSTVWMRPPSLHAHRKPLKRHTLMRQGSSHSRRAAARLQAIQMLPCSSGAAPGRRQ
jgi:hypothetical protein